MPSCTIAAQPHLLLRTRQRQDTRRYSAPRGRYTSSAGLHRRQSLDRLQRALREDLLVLHYQPIVSIENSEISHYEALVRLADQPDGGLLAPGYFLPIAERYGLVGKLDRLVIAKAIAELARHEAAAPHTAISVAVNLSALSITDPGMLTHIRRQLARWDVDPRALVLEVTETAAISDMDRAKAFCHNARTLGCRVALDDFGAGFGSFHYLKHLPFDYLKIDGDFIQNLAGSVKDQLVVKALVELARGMGKRTIAEYVTSAETLALLRDYGVDYAQGFQIGVPAPFELLALAA